MQTQSNEQVGQREGLHAPPHDLLDLMQSHRDAEWVNRTAAAFVEDRLAPVVDLYRTAARHDSEAARFVGRFDALRDGRSESPTLIVGTITVEQLAKNIGVSPATARKLLEDGHVPGARRKSPGVKNSPWIIRADAPEKYLARLEAKEA